MKKLRLTFGLVGTLGMAALTIPALAQMNMGGMTGMGTKSMDALAKLSGKSYDIAWMSQMIEHHTGALEMAQACVKTCKVAQVKAAAKGIIADQSKEISQLKGWLKTWYNSAADPKQRSLMRSDMKPMMDTASAGMSPMAGMVMKADKSFLEGMIPHHQDAVQMGQDALKKASKAELKKFARGVINAQTKEITQYNKWLKTL